MEGKSICSLNGKILQPNDATISIRDIGLQRSYGVFAYCITYNFKPFFLEAHIERLYKSAGLIGLSIPMSQSAFASSVLEALEACNDNTEKQIRMIVTGGVGLDSMTPNDENPTLAIIIDPRVSEIEAQTQGIAIETADAHRTLVDAKTLNYTEAMGLLKNARSRGAKEVIYRQNSLVFEGTTSNLFAVINGELCTPKSGILLGITRNVILNRLSLPFSIAQREITYAELKNASEIFVTASGKEIMPAVMLDGQKVGTGSVGAVTKKISKTFRDFTLAWPSAS